MVRAVFEEVSMMGEPGAGLSRKLGGQAVASPSAGAAAASLLPSQTALGPWEAREQEGRGKANSVEATFSRGVVGFQEGMPRQAMKVLGFFKHVLFFFF